MLAGALAGMGEHLVLYPVDVVKTRLMRLNPDPEARYTSVRHAFRTMIRTEVGGWSHNLCHVASGWLGDLMY